MGNDHELLKMMIALRQSEIASEPERLRAEALRLEADSKHLAVDAGVTIARTEAETKQALAQTEAETKQALAQTEAETQQVLAQTEAETKKALAQTEAETRRIVAQTEADARRDVAATELRTLELRAAAAERPPPRKRVREEPSEDDRLEKLSALPVNKMHSLSAAVWRGRPVQGTTAATVPCREQPPRGHPHGVRPAV